MPYSCWIHSACAPLASIARATGEGQERKEGRYELEVVDIYQQPVLAKGEQIIAAPTLIKKLPMPMRRITCITFGLTWIPAPRRENSPACSYTVTS